MTLIDGMGYLASALVLLTFCMSTMIPLRIAGIVSNVLFCRAKSSCVITFPVFHKDSFDMVTCLL